MNVYIDASSLLRWLLNDLPLPRYVEWQAICSSELIKNETARTMHRLRLLGQFDDELLVQKQNELESFFSEMVIIPLHPKIIEKGRAPFGTHIGTLDALHLASAIAWREILSEDVQILSHDDQLRNAARVQGFSILD